MPMLTPLMPIWLYQVSFFLQLFVNILITLIHQNLTSDFYFLTQL